MRRRSSTASLSCMSSPFQLVGQVSEYCRLLFMTYNGFIMLAVAVGAFIGYVAFGEGSASKSVACH